MAQKYIFWEVDRVFHFSKKEKSNNGGDVTM